MGGSGRKESKSYGSKDQQWEAEVKAEMVRKKLGGLKDKGVREVLKLEEVDKKLREIVSSRLDKEEEIRSEMIKVGVCELNSIMTRPLCHTPFPLREGAKQSGPYRAYVL